MNLFGLFVNLLDVLFKFIHVLILYFSFQLPITSCQFTLIILPFFNQYAVSCIPFGKLVGVVV